MVCDNIQHCSKDSASFWGFSQGFPNQLECICDSCFGFPDDNCKGRCDWMLADGVPGSSC